MTDEELVRAVLEHYAKALRSSAPAQRWLNAHGLSIEVADRFGVGFADRSLGLGLPRSNTLVGKRLRERLLGLGLTRSSGHEYFRGCVTVPVVGAGQLLGVYGCRIAANLAAGTSRELWLAGRPGGLFNASVLDGAGHRVVILAPNISVALRLISAGESCVVAPGRPQGYNESDLAAVCSAAAGAVVIGGNGGEGIGTSLSEAGVKTAGVAAGSLAGLPARVAQAAQTLAAGLGPTTTETHAGGAERASLGSQDNDGDVLGQPDVAPDRSVGEVRVRLGGRVWRIRGITRSAGFESLRANVMVTDVGTGRFHLDSVDLYSARSRAALAAGTAAVLHASGEDISAELGQVVLAAEQAADNQAPEEVSRSGPQMSDNERQEAIGWLSQADLTGAISADIAALGLVGEEDNALLVYLALTSRLARRPVSVMVQSSAAAGKSTLAEVVSSLIPPEDQLSYSALTGQALYYLPGDSLAHKVLIVAEEQGAARAVYAMRLLLSAGRLSIASTAKDHDTGKLKTRSYEVTGPVAALMTTTAAAVDDELASRLISLSVGESIAQTRAIHAAQRSAYSTAALVSTTDREAIVARHHNAQRLLAPLPVVIPMADQLSFPEATTRSRRDHDKYLSLIAASALLHQYQRPKRTIETGGQSITYLETADADVALADRLAQGVLTRHTADLPPVTAGLLRALHAWAGERPFTRRQARESLGLGDTQAKIHLARLVELEYVLATRQAGTVRYQLAWSSKDSARGSCGDRSGDGRPPVGGRSGGGRGSLNGSSVQVNGQKPASRRDQKPEKPFVAGGDSSYLRRHANAAGDHR